MEPRKYDSTTARGEPLLEDMLSDPMVQLMMHRDGVEEGEVRRALDRVLASYTAQEMVQ